MDTQLPLGLQHTWQAILAWFSHHEPLLIFLAILLEESGIPMPLPADLAMALAGHRVAQGRMSLLEAFLIGQVATLLGSSILYWVGRRGGRPLLFRYGSLLHIKAHRLAQVERMITKLGPLAIIIGRQVPGLRLASPLACGVFRVPYRVFVPAMFVGSSVYIGAFIVIGMYGGIAILAFLQEGNAAVRFAVFTVLLVGAGFLLQLLSRRARDVVTPAHRVAASSRRSLEAALLAGLGASILMALVLTWLLSLIAVLAQTPPDRALLQILERSSSVAVPRTGAGLSPQRLLFAGLLATFPFEVFTHIVWGCVYAFVFERWLRGSAGVRGLQFAIVPWLFNGLVLLPLLGVGPFALGLGTGLVPAFGELVRQAIYGISLGVLYRLVRLARQPRGHKAYRHGERHGHRHGHSGGSDEMDQGDANGEYPTLNGTAAPTGTSGDTQLQPILNGAGERYRAMDTALLRRVGVVEERRDGDERRKTKDEPGT